MIKLRDDMNVKENRTTPAGSFNSTISELLATQEFCNRVGWTNVDIYKAEGNFHDYDTVIFFKDTGKVLTVEVHQEGFGRWLKYGEYGVEDVGKYYSSKGAAPVIKPGKVDYSQADIFLFYSVNPIDNSYYMINGYWFKEYRNEWKEIVKHCPHKSGMGYNYENKSYDSWESSVYYVKPSYIADYKIVKE